MVVSFFIPNLNIRLSNFCCGTTGIKRDNLLKNGPSKIIGRKPLKIFTMSILENCNQKQPSRDVFIKRCSKNM